MYHDALRDITMRDFDFTINIKPTGVIEHLFGARAIFDPVTDLVFQEFAGDVTPALIADTLVLECTVCAPSFDAATRRVLEALTPVLGELTDERGRHRPALLPFVTVSAPGTEFVAA